MKETKNLIVEYEREKGIIQSDQLFDCIVHHAYNDIPEDRLIHEIYECEIGIIAKGTIGGPGPHIERLVNEGIMRRFMIPGDKRWYYKLSPVGKYTVKKMIETYGEEFNHPKLRSI
jgi:hypothetical protein